MEYKCGLCGYVINEAEYNEIFRCPICGVSKYHFSFYEKVEIDNKIIIDKDNPSINRVIEKCIDCGICNKTCFNVLGENSFRFDKDFCVNCGACVLNCPTGALTPKYDYKKVFEELSDNKKYVVVFTAPSVRVGLGDSFNMQAGTDVEGKMVSALRKLGFDYVLDTSFGADVTIIEEATELIDRIHRNVNLPMFTSCCPSWVKYVQLFNKDLLPFLSTTKSPNAIMGTLVKSYFANIKKLNPKNIVTVGIVPCTSKKSEAKRDDLVNDGVNNIDYILTTTELAYMIKERGIDFARLEDDDFDQIMGHGSSSGLIFGTSGGVMEATLRMVSHLLSFEELPIVSEVRGTGEFREATIHINNLDINVAVVYGLNNVQKLLTKIRNGEVNYHFVEVMTCENGCVGGAGQYLHNINRLKEVRNARLNSLLKKDQSSSVKFSYDNLEVKKLYDDFIDKSNFNKEKMHTKFACKFDINLIK